MKEGWSNKTLGEVCKIYNGDSINADYKKKHFLGATEGLPFIATKDVSSLGRIDYNNGVRIPNYEDYKVAPANSVFICAEGGSAGKKFAFVEKDVCFGNKLFCISPKDKSIAGKYVYYFVQSDIFRGQFFSLLTGLIGGVSAKKFQTIDISAPSLSEQLSIVDYLDSAFAKIDAMKANAEKALNEAKALFQKTLEETMVSKKGWEENTLGEICEIYGRIGFRGYTTKDLVQSPSDGAISLSPSNIQDGKMDYSKLTYISWFKYEESPEIKIFDGDILLVKTGSSYGKSALVQGLPHEATINPQSVVLKNCKINKAFFAYQLRTFRVLGEFDHFVSGTAIPTFSQAKLSTVSIQYPSNDEQQVIVAKLDSLKSKVDRLQENYDKISQECDALKQAILRQVFE